MFDRVTSVHESVRESIHLELDLASEQASRLINLLQEGMPQEYLLNGEADSVGLPSEYTHMTRLQLLHTEMLEVLQDGSSSELDQDQHAMLCTADTVMKNMAAVEQSVREFHVRFVLFPSLGTSCS